MVTYLVMAAEAMATPLAEEVAARLVEEVAWVAVALTSPMKASQLSAVSARSARKSLGAQ